MQMELDRERKRLIREQYEEKQTKWQSKRSSNRKG